MRVSKTQAVTSKCRNFYNMAAFPFDYQELHTTLFLLPEAKLNCYLMLGEVD